ncbi:MAG: hypothetical protein DBX48_01790 [Limosilactobacillus fermentum]|nr:MAG: hypothetical protein DBX48_01790 [Limosilactobacillus fermentum]
MKNIILSKIKFILTTVVIIQLLQLERCMELIMEHGIYQGILSMDMKLMDIMILEMLQLFFITLEQFKHRLIVQELDY